MIDKPKPKRFVHEDSLAEVLPLIVAELEAPAVTAEAELVLRRAARMDRQESYRERLKDAVRLYVRCDQVPHVVMELNKRILAAVEKKRRDDAAVAEKARRNREAKMVGLPPSSALRSAHSESLQR